MTCSSAPPTCNCQSADSYPLEGLDTLVALSVPNGTVRLTTDITAFSIQYGRYGYRWIAAMLRAEK
jgi:hypothetical protein